MLLAISIGNSNLRFVLLDGKIPIANIRLRSDRRRTSDDLAGAFAGALDAQGRGNLLRDATGVCVCSVVPILSEAVGEMCSRSLPDIPPPLFITGRMDQGMAVHYHPPQSLGADRLVSAYAAREIYGGGPLIVADFGTATTFNAIDASGAFLGGAILPGIGLGRDALVENTAQLPRLDLFAPEPIAAIGQQTVDALRSGLLLGAAAQCEGMVARIRAEMGAPQARVIATGGLGGVVARHSPIIDVVDPDLTITGLRLLYEKLTTA
ncbi:MAG: type III pantothenate kinase [Cytophagales bacterium]|nr:type III pantothenate kinase [Armatimonadota bacterium]